MVQQAGSKPRTLLPASDSSPPMVKEGGGEEQSVTQRAQCRPSALVLGHLSGTWDDCVLLENTLCSPRGT